MYQIITFYTLNLYMLYVNTNSLKLGKNTNIILLSNQQTSMQVSSSCLTEVLLAKEKKNLFHALI